MASRTIELTDIPEPMRQDVDAVRQSSDRIVIENQGKPVAGLVSRRDLELLGRIDDQRTEASEFLEEIRARFADVPEEELMAEALKSTKEARADMDAERSAAIEAIRAAAPELTDEERLKLARDAVRRVDDRLRHERWIAEQALGIVSAEKVARDRAVAAAENAVISVRSSSAAAR